MISNGSDHRRRETLQTGVVLRLGDPDRHFWLVRSVARVMGLNLGAAVARGDLGRSDFRNMVNRCRTCPRVDRCESWLAASGGICATPPPGCAVAPDLTRLKQLTPNKGAH
ncbi:MAG: DUF6455 family protein [Rhodobacterales bacterium]